MPTNKEKAIAVLESLATGDPTAIQQYISPTQYIQHNLSFPDGRETLLFALRDLQAAGTKVNIRRALADGDYVALHSDTDFFGPKAAFDIFRFENGLIVEHWDNLQERAEETPSGRTMFDGQTEIEDLGKTEANKALVKRFVEDILIGKRFDQLPPYFSDDHYIQHSPVTTDGLSGLDEVLGDMEEQGGMVYEQLHMVIGEGNFVLTVSDGTFEGTHSSFYNLFRVENDKIVEHWDVIEAILSEEQRKNNNGKF